MKLRYGSVCSGVEAASLAWQPLGWEPVFFAEVEPFPSAVLMRRWNATKPVCLLTPEEANTPKEKKLRESWKRQINDFPDGGKIPNEGDFTRIGNKYDGAIDLLAGGTPCQSYSVAGLRKGLADPRGNLALEFVRLAYRSRARWIVWENVPGVLSSDEGRDFAAFLSLLCGWEVDCPKGGWRKAGVITPAPGCFGLAWRILDAQFARVHGNGKYPYGIGGFADFGRAVPQRRRRLFVVGHIGNWSDPVKVLFESRLLLGDSAPGRKAGTGVARTLTQSTGGASAKEQQYTFIGTNNLPLNPLNGPVSQYGDLAGTLEARHDSSPCADRGMNIVCGIESGRGFWTESEISASVICNMFRDKTIIVQNINEIVISAGFMGGQSADAGSIGFQYETSPTLKATPGGGNMIPEIICVHGAQDPIHGKNCAFSVGRNYGLETCICMTTGQGNAEITIGHAPTLNCDHEPPILGIQNSICYERHDQDSRVKECGNFAPTISAKAGTGGNNLPIVSFTINDNGRDCMTECSPTLRKGGAVPADGGAIVPGVQYQTTVRRLTPMECERLMGFPDNYTRIPWKGKPEEFCPDSPRYKACGNSMCVNAMQWIGSRIDRIEQERQSKELKKHRRSVKKKPVL